jgi:uncharacterized protein (TIGR03435 family)
MKPDMKDLDKVLDRHLGLYKASSRDRIKGDQEVTLNRLRLARSAELVESPAFVPVSKARRVYLVAAIATALGTIAFAQQFVLKRPARALPVPVALPIPAPILQKMPVEAPKPSVSNTPPPARFAATSVKVMPPVTYMQGGAGLACHGVDGVARIALTVTQDTLDTLKAPQGRCVGNGVFLSTLIELAFEVQPHNVIGGPDWARTTGFLTVDVIPETSKVGAISTLPTRANSQGFAWIGHESFQVQAVASDPSKATLAELRQMLQTMLADRFGLEFHTQRRQSAGYSLVVAEGGHKLKPISGDYEESTVPTKGKSTLDKLARTLSSILVEDLTVVDKTGLKGAYEYELHVMPEDPLMARSAFISRKLEEQLGLRLQAEKSVSVEVLVIDKVTPPTPN